MKKVAELLGVKAEVDACLEKGEMRDIIDPVLQQLFKKLREEELPDVFEEEQVVPHFGDNVLFDALNSDLVKFHPNRMSTAALNIKMRWEESNGGWFVVITFYM